nr:unnamed protein product [Callosobruchus analis]
MWSLLDFGTLCVYSNFFVGRVVALSIPFICHFVRTPNICTDADILEDATVEDVVEDNTEEIQQPDVQEEEQNNDVGLNYRNYVAAMLYIIMLLVFIIN